MISPMEKFPFLRWACMTREVKQFLLFEISPFVSDDQQLLMVAGQRCPTFRLFQFASVNLRRIKSRPNHCQQDQKSLTTNHHYAFSSI